MQNPTFLNLPESENMYLIVNANYDIEYDRNHFKSIDNVLLGGVKDSVSNSLKDSRASSLKDPIKLKFIILR